MGTTSIQRLVEQHVAARGERTAILNQGDAISYRELNHRANAVARHLIGGGFRRGSHAVVRMPRGVDLAAVLLAILKAGGSYTWFDPARCPEGYPSAFAVRVGSHAGEDRFVSVDLARVLAERARPSPNLPIVTRGSDIACVLPDADGSPAVLVPHATIASLIIDPWGPPADRWTGEAGALDLWRGLMSGVTVTVGHQPLQVAAA